MPDSWLEKEKAKWRRFKLITEDRRQIEELNEILRRAKLTHKELAIIVATLRVRPGLSLEDFDGPVPASRMPLEGHEVALVREPYERHYRLVEQCSGRESSREAK